jgi:hypothetical protein
MAESTSAVEDYLELRKVARWRQPQAHRELLVRKSYAQQLARAASKSVKDRRKRAELKAEIYAHLLPLLEAHDREQSAGRRMYQKLIGALSAALIVVLALLALSLS